MIEDGDRHDRAESRRIEGEVDVAIKVKHHIVGVLVLRYDLARLPTTRSAATPGEHIAKSCERLQRRADRREATRIQPCVVVHWNHGVPKRSLVFTNQKLTRAHVATAAATPAIQP